jgi:iron complex outermembrane receptor protein
MNDSNTIVAGATYEKQKFYDDEVWANWLTTPEGMIRYESFQKLPGGEFSPDQKIDFKALFLEDIWDITEELRLTLGARYDDYSTFGGEFSPRAGLTWEFIKGYDLKMLYGHAFAVPNIFEIVGTAPDTTLGPQTMDSYELSLGAEFTSSFESRVTLFRFYDKDLITWAEGPYTNRGEMRTQGVEVEARYDFGRGTWVAGSYSYTSLKDGYGPSIYVGKVICNIRLSRYLNFNVDGYLFSGFGDPDYYEDFSGGADDRTIMNATLIARNFLKDYEELELRASVYNLFDKDWSEMLWEVTPYGLPQPGINFLVGVRYMFKN